MKMEAPAQTAVEKELESDDGRIKDEKEDLAIQGESGLSYKS